MKFYKENSEKVNLLLHYSFKKIFSFAVKFMYLIGGRGYGKGYGVKTFCIKDFIKNNNKFAWFRSTDTALNRIRQPLQFFGRMKNLKELGVKNYDIKNDIIYINKKIAGYLFPIATSHNIKGADYECVNGVWDEFMRDKGERPVVGKREKFMSLVESIFRQDKSRIFLVSNATNQFDECLAPFNITLKQHGIYLYRKENALIHFIQPSEAYKKSRENSLSFIGMSEQEKKMAYENSFTNFGDYGKETKGRYIYSLQVDDNKFLSIYSSEGKLYIKNILPEINKIYTMNNEYVNSVVNKLSTASKKVLLTMHDRGEITFFDGYCRTIFQDSIV